MGAHVLLLLAVNTMSERKVETHCHSWGSNLRPGFGTLVHLFDHSAKSHPMFKRLNNVTVVITNKKRDPKEATKWTKKESARDLIPKLPNFFDKND
jgi:hypothetical protein